MKRSRFTADAKLKLASRDNCRTLRRVQTAGPSAPSKRAVARHVHPRRMRSLVEARNV